MRSSRARPLASGFDDGPRGPKSRDDAAMDAASEAQGQRAGIDWKRRPGAEGKRRGRARDGGKR
eukprot:7265756-Pyramimonas_sp.AAC.1